MVFCEGGSCNSLLCSGNALQQVTWPTGVVHSPQTVITPAVAAALQGVGSAGALGALDLLAGNGLGGAIETFDASTRTATGSGNDIVVRTGCLVTGIADTIVVRVDLIHIGNGRTVVFDIADGVAVLIAGCVLKFRAYTNSGIA